MVDHHDPTLPAEQRVILTELRRLERLGFDGYHLEGIRAALGMSLGVISGHVFDLVVSGHLELARPIPGLDREGALFVRLTDPAGTA